MKDIMRKHLWPASLVAALAVVGMLAAFVVLAGPERETAEAQTLCDATGPLLQVLIDQGVCPDPANATPAPTGTGPANPAPPGAGTPAATTPPGQTGDACAGLTGDALQALIDLGICMAPTNTPEPTNTPTPVPPTATTGPPPTNTPEPTPTPNPMVGDSFESSSTSANATVKLTLTIGNLPESMLGGSSIELYLEDDFKVPDTIDRGSVYFTVENPTTDRTGGGGRVYATDPIEIDTDGHFTADKDDYAIQVVIPDMNTADRQEFDGFQGPEAGQTLKVVFTKGAGIKNASEAGTHSVAYSVLGPNDDTNDGPEYPKDPQDRNKVKPFTVSTVGKISLSDVDNTRGYELTVTGSGFNNGTSAAVHVLHAVDRYPAWWDSLDDTDDNRDCTERNRVARSTHTVDTPDGYCRSWGSLTATQQAKIRADVNLLGGGADPADNASDEVKAAIAAAKATAEATFCRHIISEGHRAGIAEVGSDDIVAVEFEVTVPIFGPGNTNYLCMVDGEGRSAGTDVEDFKLEPSIRISPTLAGAGDKINLFAQDFSGTDDPLKCLKIASQPVYYSGTDAAGDRCVVATDNKVKNLRPAPISGDGSAAISFDLPGSISGSALEGTVRIDATWGGDTEDAKVTVSGSILRLSLTEVRANESITIQGDGFGDQYVDAAKITIDGVPLRVDDDSKNSQDQVTVSNAGQFVATVAVWPQATGLGSDNPALIAGTHTIRVEDEDGFFGTASLIIKEPSMTITPDTLGPRDYITITGTDWPVDNADGGSNTNVEVTVSDDDTRADRLYSVIPDATGRFVVEHRVSRNVGIPSTNQVRASYGEGVIVKVASFKVPAATIEITPTEGQPGDEVTMTVEGMKVYAEVTGISIGGADVRGGRSFRTDRDGSVTAEGLVIPGLDPGTYSVEMRVGAEDDQTVAIGSIDVQPEVVAGAVAMLPDALEALDDNLEAVFYFDNVSKEWSFYDPREEFADLNTLDGMIAGQAYWILVGEAVDEVVLNAKTRSLTCSNGDCWNLVVW